MYNNRAIVCKIVHVYKMSVCGKVVLMVMVRGSVPRTSVANSGSFVKAARLQNETAPEKFLI